MRRKKKTPLLKPISATVPPDMLKQIERIAKDEHYGNLSQVVRVALAEYIQRRAAA